MTHVKCLVWDLDNTLWNGTLLEDDRVELVDGVLDTVRALDERGILQSVASKNDADLALRRLTELGVADYFVLPKIGWGPKSDSVREIAEELRFAPEAVAFVDDQPQERAEVEFGLPAVRCYPAEQAVSLAELPEFTPTTVTTDSRRRRRMYQAGFRRDAERAAFRGPDQEFLRSLELEMTIGKATGQELGRVEELTVRTTQMNTTGVFYAEDTLRGMIANPAHEVLTVTITDRFGPYGAVGVVVLDRHPDAWHVKLLATSCRVVSLGAGALVLNWLVNEAERAGVHLLADFRPTERNRIMEVTYRFAGFEDDPCACAGPLPAQDDGVLRLHLTPAPRELSPVIRLTAADLSEPARTSVAS
ncbi:HAD-IIIC family phosphatase [Actinophytocola gossypii]|uniref:HAD-IIIC family phosphatase n=1 Tax=Actinophytocola gossypii TaxID=2812003 RepID=A0ABT2JK93_9PSEU|nr:HAD-IIIC family phosphatase [Actinophytocola gossypii]MCT2588313.1 HAD-IIIC family phosphatase [Actinophytocola gossypii]